jgi:aerobic carbon-monoxide dehydrogenase large subunit
MDSVTHGGARFVGQRIRRREDPRFLRGDTRYVDDIQLPRMAHVAFVRSDHGHALVRGIDIEALKSRPGFLGVLTGQEARKLAKPIRCDSSFPEFKGADWHALASDRVRFAGEALVAVAAQNRYVAEDLAEQIIVAYEPLPAAIDIESILADPIPFHDGWADNLFLDRLRIAGDADKAFADADLVFEDAYQIHRHTGYPLEPRGCIADFVRASGVLTLYSATQIPHLVRSALAEALQLPEHRIRVISPDVGGGFGTKAQFFPEEIVISLMSMRLGRPVKWIEDSREHLSASVHARDHRHRVAIAFRKDGKILGVKADIVVDVGAYSVFPWTPVMDGGLAAAMLIAPYAIENYQARIRCVATNKTPFGAYRGVGGPAAAFTMERALDDAARQFGFDPVALRLLNHVPDDAYPYHHANGGVYDNASMVATLRCAAQAIGYETFGPEQAEARAKNRYIGIGFATYIEQTGHTHDFVRRGTPISFGYESARVSLDPSGHVTIHTSLHSHGQGHETTFAQVAADHLGIPVEHIRVQFGDTDMAPYGMGTFASRSAVLGSGAVAKASDCVRNAIVRLAAHLLEASPEDLNVRDAVVHLKGTDLSIGLREVARIAFHRPERLPAGLQTADFCATQSYDAAPGTGTWANAVHAAIVEVDPTTGMMKILRYLVVEDCGTIINPLIVDGQVHGGAAQGIGGAMLEHIDYDANGQLLSQTMMEYLLPSTEDLPHIEVIHLATPSPFTESGIKGVGEGGAVGPMAALGNAVSNALAPFGVSVHTLPLTPDRILSLLATRPENAEDAPS